MAQNVAKIGQNLVFIKYSRIIHRWKVYVELITIFVKMFEFFHFGAQNGPKGTKMVKKVFFPHTVASYIVQKIFAR